MATATCNLSEEQFLCSICLNVLTEPVATPCGHSFCKNCIDQHWASRVYNCPYCKQVFSDRPVLRVNILISEMVQQFRGRATVSAKRAAPGEVGCNLCPKPKLKALKSCLFCLSPLCDMHCQSHQLMCARKGHKKMEPVMELSGQVCEEHNKPLELFCSQEKRFICVLCLCGRDNDHEVQPVKFVCEKQLWAITGKIDQEISDREDKIQALRCFVEQSNSAAEREVTDGEKFLRALKDIVERSLEELVLDISMKKKLKEENTTREIAEIELEINKLREKRSGLEQLAQTEDHFAALENMAEYYHEPKSDRTDIDIYLPNYRDTVLKIVSGLDHKFSNKTRRLLEEHLHVITRLSEIGVRLNADTAHPQLTVSEDGTAVQHSREKTDVPDSPDRFDKGLFVLGMKIRFSQFYFEVRVWQKYEWTVGVAEKSVNRKGEITLSPENGFWTLSFRNDCYYASDPKVHVCTRCRPATIGVLVNSYDNTVCFYDAEAKYLIYSYTDFCTTRKVFPIFSPGHYNELVNSVPLLLKNIIDDKDY